MNELKHTSPVIVFDSGFGGISVLKKLLLAMPDEHYLYLGDSLNAPYGPRSKEEITRLAVTALSSLKETGPKAVVVACNTATAAAIDEIRLLFPALPVIGMTPAVEEASASCRCVLVLATESTIASDSLKAQLALHEKDAELIPLAAPGLVTYVEGMMKDRDGTLAYAKELFLPFADKPVDGVVLGCTHFPFAKDVITEALGKEVPFFDASDHAAVLLKETLQANGTISVSDEKGSITFINTAKKREMLSFAWTLLMSG